MEPTFNKPQAYVELPPALRAKCKPNNTDYCVIEPETERERFFVRAVMPAQVVGRQCPMHWGVWVEFLTLKGIKYYAANEYEVGKVFEVVLANRLPGYPETVGLPGRLKIVHPKQRPRFYPHNPAGGDRHPLVEELCAPVAEHRVTEWLQAMEQSRGR